MDTKDRPEPSLPAIPLRFATGRPAVLENSAFGKSSASSGEPPTSVNLARAIFRAIGRHWWQILLIWGLTTGGLLYVISMKVRPIYVSDSLLRVEPNFKDIFGTGMHASEAFGPFMETQVQLIQSPNVLSAALADPKVSGQPSLRGVEDPESAMRKQLQVSTVKDTYLLRVSMSSTDSIESATIVNAVVKEYLDEAIQWSNSMTKAQIDSLETYRRDIQAQYDNKYQALLALAEKNNVKIDMKEPEREDQPKETSSQARSRWSNIGKPWINSAISRWS